MQADKKKKHHHHLQHRRQSMLFFSFFLSVRGQTRNSTKMHHLPFTHKKKGNCPMHKMSSEQMCFPFQEAESSWVQRSNKHASDTLKKKRFCGKTTMKKKKREHNDRRASISDQTVVVYPLSSVFTLLFFFTVVEAPQQRGPPLATSRSRGECAVLYSSSYAMAKTMKDVGPLTNQSPSCLTARTHAECAAAAG